MSEEIPAGKRPSGEKTNGEKTGHGMGGIGAPAVRFLEGWAVGIVHLKLDKPDIKNSTYAKVRTS